MEALTTLAAAAGGMEKLETDPFLNELNKMFDRNAAKRSISIILKRSEHI